MRSVKIPYRQENHGSFEEEWPLHRGVSDWWYVTGYLTEVDDPERLYSYQFTFIRPFLYGFAPVILQLALTDVRDHQHVYRQRMLLYHPDVYVTRSVVNFLDIGRLERRNSELALSSRTDQFSLNLKLEKSKDACWHGDDGVLVMGLPEDAHQRTVYTSYTNLNTSGTLTLYNWQGSIRTLKVVGKSWFDHQWGPYNLINSRTHWEWFSLRFFDNEEVMLFAFPQDNYVDGTYIKKRGQHVFVRDYSYTPKAFVEVSGMLFSKGWDLYMPDVKEEHYEIKPLSDGQLNLAYYELLAEILNPRGEQVGYCIVELLPGARNLDKKIDFMNLFKKVEG